MRENSLEWSKWKERWGKCNEDMERAEKEGKWGESYRIWKDYQKAERKIRKELREDGLMVNVKDVTRWRLRK